MTLHRTLLLLTFSLICCTSYAQDDPRKNTESGNEGFQIRKKFIVRTGEIKSPFGDPATFKPSPLDSLTTGRKVLHLKFGEGLIESVEPNRDGEKVATIRFYQLDPVEKKRIMLRFAKLQVVD